jgi:hypothetical protein
VRGPAADRVGQESRSADGRAVVRVIAMDLTISCDSARPCGRRQGRCPRLRAPADPADPRRPGRQRPEGRTGTRGCGGPGLRRDRPRRAPVHLAPQSQREPAGRHALSPRHELAGHRGSGDRPPAPLGIGAAISPGAGEGRTPGGRLRPTREEPSDAEIHDDLRRRHGADGAGGSSDRRGTPVVGAGWPPPSSRPLIGLVGVLIVRAVFSVALYAPDEASVLGVTSTVLLRHRSGGRPGRRPGWRTSCSSGRRDRCPTLVDHRPRDSRGDRVAVPRRGFQRCGGGPENGNDVVPVVDGEPAGGVRRTGPRLSPRVRQPPRP